MLRPKLRVRPRKTCVTSKNAKSLLGFIEVCVYNKHALCSDIAYDAMQKERSYTAYDAMQKERCYTAPK